MPRSKFGYPHPCTSWTKRAPVCSFSNIKSQWWNQAYQTTWACKSCKFTFPAEFWSPWASGLVLSTAVVYTCICQPNWQIECFWLPLQFFVSCFNRSSMSYSRNVGEDVRRWNEHSQTELLTWNSRGKYRTIIVHPLHCIMIPKRTTLDYCQ